MSIMMVGIDHNVADLDVRANFSMTSRVMGELLEQWKKELELKGIVIISTCNRMEIYASYEDEKKPDLYGTLSRHFGTDEEAYRPFFAERYGKDAVVHLFRLAAGLESMILGEDQIITQIGDAIMFARDFYVTDKVMETMFRQALTVGKKIKTNVRLSSTDQSVVHAALAYLEKEKVDFNNKTCMVIGNGVMGKLAATLLNEKGAHVTSTVRQYTRGMVEVAPGCERINYGDRMNLFPKCDFVISATLSPNYTLTKEMVEGAVEKPVTLIDLAVPRDIEVAVADIENVTLYDIDRFKADVYSPEQQAKINQAEALIEEEYEEFEAWYDVKDEVKRIGKIKVHAAKDVVLRMTPAFKKYDLSPEEKDEMRSDIDHYTQNALNKIIFELRDNLSTEDFRELLDILERLYEED